MFVATRWYFHFSSLFLGRYDVGNYRQIDSDIKITNKIRLFVSLFIWPKKEVIKTAFLFFFFSLSFWFCVLHRGGSSSK